MEPLASTVIKDGKTTNNEPLAALPPELPRLLPPGVRSVSPTPSPSMSVHIISNKIYWRAAVVESATERKNVNQDEPTKPTEIDRVGTSATQNQDKSARKRQQKLNHNKTLKERNPGQAGFSRL